MRRVEVFWTDSSDVFCGWLHIDEANRAIAGDPLSCSSVGYLFHEGKDAIVIVRDTATDQVGSGIKIPKTAIKEINDLHSGKIIHEDLEVEDGNATQNKDSQTERSKLRSVPARRTDLSFDPPALASVPEVHGLGQSNSLFRPA